MTVSATPEPSPGLPSYRDALSWLYSCVRGAAPRDPARMAALLEALALPSPDHVVHVVGTNGKGTVTAMVDAGLRAWGEPCGRFVSPHVEDFRERVSVDGKPVSRETVRRFAARAQRLAIVPAPAFFEWTLALALTAFARARLRWAVVEAGVGGARDATRALTGVRLVVLTNVTPDHLETLGPDLDSIARDKAGALRPGIPAVTGARGDALKVVRAEARRLGAPLFIESSGQPLFDLPALGRAIGTTRTANARLAAAALRLLGAPEEAVATGIAAPPLPGRGERYRVRGCEVLLDGAHDPAAAEALAADLEPGFVLLFGALARKQAAATLAALERSAAAVVLTEAALGEHPPSVRPGDRFLVDPGRALDLALTLAAQGASQRPDGPPPRVVVAGSLYLAGRLRPLLRRRARPHASPTVSTGTRP